LLKTLLCFLPDSCRPEIVPSATTATTNDAPALMNQEVQIDAEGRNQTSNPLYKIIGVDGEINKQKQGNNEFD
jgi:hypothetical protein